MKILLATSNQGKAKEIKAFFKEYDIYALNEVLEPFDIEENGSSFKQNALIKARAVYEKLIRIHQNNDWIALSDDSGISVEALDWRPGIFSARYSGANATDATNRAKMIAELHTAGVRQSAAFYTACIAVASPYGEFCAHGFMHGLVIDEERGENGFGYDFMFIPRGYDKTIGELSSEIKAQISHRTKALNLIKYVLNSLGRKMNSR